MPHKYFITDVFTNTRYSGNQLATVILDSDTPTPEMQRIAREFNFSETTFVLNPKDGATMFNTRIFTPDTELPFAGHPTLGTAYLMKKYYNASASKIDINLKAGVIPVDTSDKTLWMTQNPAEFFETYSPAEISPVINISQDDIRTDIPIQGVSTGLATLIIPLKSLDAVKRAWSSLETTRAFMNGKTDYALYLFAEETYNQSNQINARVFVDVFGISEDPATGSATGCLGAYLHKYYKNTIDVSIEQGFEISRESILKLHVDNTAIKVGGEVVLVADGTLY